MQKNIIAAAALVAALAGSAFAQPLTGKKLIAGFDETVAGATTLWAYDFDTSTWSPLASGVQVWGLAADDVNGYLYVASSGNNMWRIPYDTLIPENLGTFVSAITGGTINFVSLAYNPNTGKLYATRNISSTAGAEGLYEIDPATRVATLLYAYNTAYDIGGLDWNPADGELYGTNDTNNTTLGISPGLVKLQLNGTITQIGGVPSFAGDGGTTAKDIDGLAIGEGKAYLVTDQPGETGVWDFATSAYLAPLTNPFPTPEVFSGGAFVNTDAVTPCPSDFNGDSFVDDSDFVTFAAAYEAFTIPPADPAADLNGDGFVDDADFVEFAAAYEAFVCP